MADNNSTQQEQTSKANPKAVLLVIGIVLVVAFAAISLMLGGTANQTDDYEGMGSRTQNSQNGSADEARSMEAPDVTLSLADGTQKKLSDSRGKIVILSFWATWCPYCIEEMPDIQRIVENYDNVEAILVNCGEDTTTVESFMSNNNYDFTWALDQDYAVQSAYPTSGIPYTLVIDAEGNVVQAFSGSKPSGMYDDFAAAVEKAQS